MEAILQLQSLGSQLQVLHCSLGLASTARYTAVSVCRDFTLLLVFLYFAFLMFFSKAQYGGKYKYNTEQTSVLQTQLPDSILASAKIRTSSKGKKK